MGAEVALELGRTYQGRQVEVYHHFTNLADYIWKLPRLLDSEIEIEKGKLQEYFPLTGDPAEREAVMARRRWRFFHEFGKLLIEFPDFMGSSSFVMVLSRFEYFLLQICKDHEAATGISLAGFERGKRGTERLLKFISAASPEVDPDEKLEQVRNAQTLRNCLVHANGVVTLSTEPAKIRNILKQKLYYPKGLRKEKDDDKFEHHPKLKSTPLGERVVIPVLHAHWMCYAVREVLMSLCVEASIGEGPAASVTG